MKRDRVLPPVGPWVLIALALSLLTPRSALATLIPFASRQNISPIGFGATMAVSADVDGDGDLDVVAAADERLDLRFENTNGHDAQDPPLGQAFYYIVSPENGCASGSVCLQPSCVQTPARDC